LAKKDLKSEEIVRPYHSKTFKISFVNSILGKLPILLNRITLITLSGIEVII
jgi:hypothetical protein